MDLNIEVAVNSDDLACSLVQVNTYPELIEFIKTIDDQVGDWEFTQELFDYFTLQLEFKDSK